MFETVPDHKLEAMVRLLLQAVDERLDVVRQHQVVLEECLTNAFDHIAELNARLDEAAAEIDALHGRAFAPAPSPEVWAAGPAAPAPAPALDRRVPPAERESALGAALGAAAARPAPVDPVATLEWTPVASSRSEAGSFAIDDIAAELDAKLASLMRSS